PRFSSGAQSAFEPTSRPVLALWRLLKSFIPSTALRRGPPSLGTVLDRSVQCRRAKGSGHCSTGRSIRLQKVLWLAAAVELFTGLFFVYLWKRFGLSWQLLLLAFTCSFFLLVAIIDQRYRLILNVMIYPAAVVTLLLRAISSVGDIPATLLGGALGFSVFLLAALVRRDGLGGGDIKLAALIGLVVGFPEVLWALAAGIVAGGIAALILVFLARWEIKSHIPYAPFLCLGAIIALLYNPLPLFLPSR
ncbi:MAG: A24 family peptidase, partial [Dehalococcoidia bacterium]